MVITCSSDGATKRTHLEAYTTNPATKTQGSKASSPHKDASNPTAPRDKASKRKRASPESPVAKKQKTGKTESNNKQNDQQYDKQSKKGKPETSLQTSPEAKPEAKKAKPESRLEAKANTTPPKKKTIAKSSSGQTKLNKENVTQELASPAATQGYKKSTTTTTSHPKATENETKTESQTETRNENENESENENDIITINRAPVLTLWSASTTSFLHPKLSWSTCLSAGQAISRLCAISKGRAIGKIDSSSTTDAPSTEKSASTKNGGEEDELKIMHFSLSLREGIVVLGGKDEKNANEGALKAKFGGVEVYERVKKVFGEGLETWRGREGELNEKAFGMYEEFRPDVASGQKGWGRKGSLNLGKVREVIARE